MEMAMIGLGRMGGNMVLRLLRRGHRLVVHDRSEEAIQRHEAQGAVGARSLEEVVGTLRSRPRVIWLMLPAGDPTKETIARLAELGEAGDIVVDGGNTNWRLAL